MEQVRRYLFLWAAMVALVFTPTAANAFALLQCDGNGSAIGGTTLFDADPTNHTGECMYSNQPVVQHVFSTVICNFVIILNQIMDSMYCGMHYYLITTISALLTLYLTVYGAQILMGTAQLSTRDAITRLLKLSFIYVFATQSAYGISLIFNFFMGFIADASTAVLNSLSNSVGAQTDGVCNFYGLDGSNVMSMYSFLDYLVCHAFLGPASTANSKVLGFFMGMIAALFPMTLMFQWWLMLTINLVKDTLIAFLKAVAVIAFLVTLSPVFLGFFLFQSTTYLFENWLRYLVSFSVQIVIIIAMVVFWIMTINQFVGFFNELSELIYPYEPIEIQGGIFRQATGWAICPPKYDIDFNGEPTAACANGFNAYPPNWCPIHSRCTPDEYNNTLQVYLRDQMKLLPPEAIIAQGEFLYYIFYHLITLLLISYAFSVLLNKADEIATSLAGPSSAPALVPGWGNNLGNANSFKAPPFAKTNPGNNKGASKLAADFHKLVGK